MNEREEPQREMACGIKGSIPMEGRPEKSIVKESEESQARTAGGRKGERRKDKGREGRK